MSDKCKCGHGKDVHSLYEGVVGDGMCMEERCDCEGWQNAAESLPAEPEHFMRILSAHGFQWASCLCGWASHAARTAHECAGEFQQHLRNTEASKVAPVEADRWELYNPHPSGMAHGCPYDYNDPETDRILREERGLIPPSVGGTFNCPICGVDHPHEHTGDEIAKFHGAKVAEPKPTPSTHEESAMWIVSVKAANEAYLKQFEDELPSERTYGVNRISVWRLPQHVSLIDLIDKTQSCTSGLSFGECLEEIKRRLGE